VEIKVWEVNQTAMGEEMQRTCAALRVESFYTLPTAEDTGVVYCGEIGERTNARWRLNRIKAEMSQSRSMYQSSELVRPPPLRFATHQAASAEFY
jgi:hypothetical protein